MVESIPPDKLGPHEADPSRAVRRAVRDRRRSDVPRVGGGGLHHRHCAAGRRRSLDVTRATHDCQPRRT
jgi:hypothetical protein